MFVRTRHDVLTQLLTHYSCMCASVLTDICGFFLQKLELSNNKIRSMDGLQGHKYLEMIDLEENEVRFLNTFLLNAGAIIVSVNVHVSGISY